MIKNGRWFPKLKAELKRDGFKIVKCEHCHRPITVTNLPEIIVFCSKKCVSKQFEEVINQAA